MTVASTRVLTLATVITVTSGAHAQEPGWHLDGGVTAVSLHPSGGAPEADRTLSADLFIRRRAPRGEWMIYLEGNSSLDVDAASTVLIETNADAGTALDPDREGRLQISEINYRAALDNGAYLTAGLLDASAYLDRTRITNDENVQFLGASFVNNPTIEFPDYTIGIVYERPRDGAVPQLNAVLTSANGLADNPNLSYSQLLQLSDDDDGAFAAIGVGWPFEKWLFRVGAWVNTRPHLALDGRRDDATNYGGYAVLGRSWGDHGLNVRLGLADAAITEGSRFASLAYRVRWREHALGAGIARTFLSSKIVDPNLDDSTQMELFARFNMTRDVHVTLSIQRIIHSGFIALPADPRDSARLAGLRFHVAF